VKAQSGSMGTASFLGIGENTLDAPFCTVIHTSLTWMTRHMHRFSAICFLLSLSTATFSAAIERVDAPIFSASGAVLTVTTASGSQQTIHTAHPISTSNVSFEDLNFDGHADIKVFDSAGNVQRFYSVYLYDPRSMIYRFDSGFSKVPCVEADKTTHEVVGACFHVSACENWVERYSVDRRNRLTLLSRKGTYCNPSTGESFSYDDRFENGRRISSRITQLHSNQDRN
jgi:hypothetical protein